MHAILARFRYSVTLGDTFAVRRAYFFVSGLAAIASLFSVAAEGAGRGPQPLSPDELAKFLGPVPADQFTWKVLEGPDFSVYYGEPHPPLTGTVEFYVGGAPGEFKPSRTAVKSRLGRFRVTWHRTTNDDGTIHQETIDDAMGLKAHVWAEAPNEVEMTKLLSVVGRLPIFSAGAIPARYRVFHDIFAREQRIRRMIWIGWCALTLAIASVIDWFARRRRFSVAARLFAFGGVIALSIAFTVGTLATMPHVPQLRSVSNFLIDSFVKARIIVLFASAAAVAAVAFLFGLCLLILRLFRRATPP